MARARQKRVTGPHRIKAQTLSSLSQLEQWPRLWLSCHDAFPRRQQISDANRHGVLCCLGSRGHVPTPPGPAICHGPASTRKAKVSCEGRALANSTAPTLALFLPVVRGNTTVALVVGLTLAFVVGSGHRMAATSDGISS